MSSLLSVPFQILPVELFWASRFWFLVSASLSLRSLPCSLKVCQWKMQKNHHIIFLLKQYSYAYLSFNCIHLHIQIEYKTFQQYSERTFERYFHHNWVSQSITFSGRIKLKILKCCSNIVKHVRNVAVSLCEWFFVSSNVWKMSCLSILYAFPQ